MRLGTLHLQTVPWLDLGQEFRDAEAAGVDVAYVADHLTHPTLADVFVADGWAVLAAASQHTRRIDLGTLVAAAGFRSPLPMARAAATVQEVSDGRFVLGLGAGTAADVEAATGHAVTAADLARRLADTVTGLDRIFRGEQSGIDSLPVARGRSRPFLLLAAHGPQGFDLVGRYADGWSTYGGPRSVALEPAAYWDLLAEQGRAVDDACRRHDRDPSRLRRSLLLGYGTIHPVASPATFTECLERAATLGFDEVVVYWPRGGAGTRFWADPSVFADCLAVPRR